MCLTNESKSPPIKLQYENGEIVCWVVAYCYSNRDRLFSPYWDTEYRLGKRIKAKNLNMPSAGRHGFLRLEHAIIEQKSWYKHLERNYIIIKATVKSKDVIKFGIFRNFPCVNSPALRAKAMLYQRVVK